MSDPVLDYNFSKIIHHVIDWSKIDDNSIIVDAGASDGDTLKLIREKTNCLICAIEPDPGVFNRMIHNALNFPKLYQDKYAFSNKALTGNSSEENVDFYSHNTAGSLIKDLYANSEQIRAKTLKIKDLFNEFGIDHIDWLKMNIVGAEKEVLDDMSEDMANNIKQASIHVYYQQIQNMELPQQIDDRLKQLGFKTLKFYAGMEIYAYRG